MDVGVLGTCSQSVHEEASARGKRRVPGSGGGGSGERRRAKAE
jgi:hypothetical protein